MSTSNDTLETFQGDSTKTIRFGLRTTDALTGYTCNINVTNIDLTDVAPAIARAVTDKVTVSSKEYFVISLTPAETAGLTIDTTYILGMQILNNSLNFKREAQVDIAIKEGAVSV